MNKKPLGRLFGLAVGLFALLGAGCLQPQRLPAGERSLAVGLALIESQPIETSLDRADLADAAPTWIAMIDAAQKSLDFAEYYASEAEPSWREHSRLSAVIDAVTRAVRRGVRVRFLTDAKMALQYPDTLAALAAAGVSVRRLDLQPLSGGVFHAKYFVVDGREAFVGSQNFDWRALSHTQELGVRLASRELSQQLLSLFAYDWALAMGQAGADPPSLPSADRGPALEPRSDGDAASLVASPRDHLPPGIAWELPQILALLAAAKSSIVVQVMVLATHERSGQAWLTLDGALRQAAARGVRVRLLVSEWALRGEARRSCSALSDAIEVRVLRIPHWSGGEIPFSRVAHAKYLVVDGQQAWLGSSNWEERYFFKSRNVGLVLKEPAVPARMQQFFDENWSSPYAEPWPR